MRSSTLLAAIALAVVSAVVVLSAPSASQAAPCPPAQSCGGSSYTHYHFAANISPTVCSIFAVTAMYPCGNATYAYADNPNFVVSWLNTPIRIIDPTGGGIFKCGTGPTNICKVGRTGLPVELLSFGVE